MGVCGSTVGRAQAASFDATNYLEHVTNAALSPVPPLAFACWVNLTLVSANQYIAGKWNAGGEWVLLYDTTFGWKITVITNAGTQVAISNLAATTGVWTHVGWSLSAGGLLVVYVNGVNAGQNAAGGNVFPNSNTQPLRLGRMVDGSAMAGAIDAAGLWNRATVDMASLYNAGAGKAVADLNVTDSAGLAAGWDLDEVTGSATWCDVLNSNNLTAGGTVGSVAGKV